MYFRLAAAIFDLQVTPTSESIQICAIVLLDLTKFGMLSEILLYHVRITNLYYIRSDGRHFDFGGRGLTFFGSQDIGNNVYVIPYRLVKTT